MELTPESLILLVAMSAPGGTESLLCLTPIPPPSGVGGCRQFSSVEEAWGGLRGGKMAGWRATHL